ncbi:hypothetical protein CHISP_2158 [Chitinispirillum alkaliphilum]|nr:hypothetical protein CHISP_2158 [Chitinispirillum alkaliphilum]
MGVVGHFYRIKMFGICFIILFCFRYSFPNHSKTENTEIFNLIIDQDYEGARRLTNERLSANPRDFDALYYSLTIEQTKILDYESYSIEGKRFNRFADSVLNELQCKAAMLNGEDSLRCVFYIANILGSIGLTEAKMGSRLDGARKAHASAAMLRDILDKNPDFTAANHGIGVFDYYLGNSLSWVPFVGNRAQRGLKMLWAALDAPSPFNYAAKNSLCWILIEKGEYCKADSLASLVLEVSPRNSIFLKIKALAALRSGRYNDAIPLAVRLIELSEIRNPINWSDLVTGYYILVKSYEYTGKGARALKKSEKILTTAVPDEFKKIPHVERQLEYLEKTRITFQE